MEEILYKIDSANSIISSDAVHLLVKNIMKTIDENKNASQLEESYQFLRDKCGCENYLVSSTACQGLLNLIKFGYVQLDPALSLAMTVVLTAKTFTGIVSVVSKILEMKVLNEIQEKSMYTCSWNTASQTHPFITIIKLHPVAIQDVYNEIENLCSRTSIVYEHCIELLRPVFLWLLCHPKETYSGLNYRRLFELILRLDDLPEQMSLILECVGLQQTSLIKCSYTYESYSVLVEWAITRKSNKLLLALLPAIANIAHSLTVYCKNPKACFVLIKKMISHIQCCKFNYEEISPIINCTTCMLGDTIRQCPVANLGDLVEICKELCNMLNCPISISLLIAAFLQWDYNKNILSLEFNEEIRKLLDTLRNFDHKLYAWKAKEVDNEMFQYFKSINRRIYVADTLCQYYKTIVTDRDAYQQWKELWKTPTNQYLKCEHILYLQGLLIFNHKLPIVYYEKIDIINAVTDIVNKKEDLMFGQMPIALYCLKISKSPTETTLILKTIPVLANLRENVPIVIGILKCLESNDYTNSTHFIKSSACAFVIKLYMILVEKQMRCYPYLHTIVAKSVSSNISKSWELLTAQASAMKQICEGREVNANDVVPLLSEIIRQSSTSESETACCLCLDSIGTLWKKDIIDPRNSWQVLAPRFSNENRDAVKISICKLLSIVPDIYNTPSEHDDFVNNVIFRLWKYIENRCDVDICIAAFTALSNFKLESMTLKQIPDVYRAGIKIPPNLLKLSTDTNPKPEDVLSYIPSIVWGNMFKYTNAKLLPGVSILCHRMMEREVTSYRVGIYNSNVAEPETAKYLPSASVVGGVLEYIRKELVLTDSKDKLSDNVFECLKCLSVPLGKPLPPLNWSFVFELLKDESVNVNVKMSILQLLTLQADTSPSAMKILIDYLDTREHKTKDTEMFFELLPRLFRCIKPKKILPVVEEQIECSYCLMQSDGDYSETNMFSYTFKYLMQCFKDDKVDNNLKIALGNIVIKHWDDIDYDNPIWPKYAEVCSELPDEVLKNIVFSINKKSSYLRCILALQNDTENNLDWLNDMVDAALNQNRNDQLLFLTMASNVLSKIDTENRYTRTWFTQLMTKMQIEMISETATRESVEFLYDMLITFAIVLSKQEIFGYVNDKIVPSTVDKLKIFPQILNSYFEDKDNIEFICIGNQIMDWIMCNKNNALISNDTEQSIKLALISCRHIPTPEMWSRHISALIGDNLQM